MFARDAVFDLAVVEPLDLARLVELDLPRVDVEPAFVDLDAADDRPPVFDEDDFDFGLAVVLDDFAAFDLELPFADDDFELREVVPLPFFFAVLPFDEREAVERDFEPDDADLELDDFVPPDFDADFDPVDLDDELRDEADFVLEVFLVVGMLFLRVIDN